jgi:peptidylprolyl isomerase
MPSRRTAETWSLGIVLAAAVTASSAWVLTKRDAPPPPPEPHFYCALPAKTELACDAPREAFPSGQVPADVAQPTDATTTPSGVAIRMLSAGCPGPTPGAEDQVDVTFIGWNAKGEQIVGAQSARFPIKAVVPGFAEALRTMRAGDRVRVWIPGPLAYDRIVSSHRDKKIQGQLTFEIELKAITGPR